jgi:hypothetical protein
MSEPFTIDGFTYRAGPMDTRVQLHVVRRITPLMTAVPDMLKDGVNLMDAIMPFAEALSAMEDKDVDYVLDHCLAIIERKQAGDRPWAKIWSSGGIMFEDITILAQLKLAARVIIDVLGPFFPALALKLNGAAGA